MGTISALTQRIKDHEKETLCNAPREKFRSNTKIHTHPSVKSQSLAHES